MSLRKSIGKTGEAIKKGSEVVPSEPLVGMTEPSERQLRAELRLTRDVGEAAASHKGGNCGARGAEAG